MARIGPRRPSTAFNSEFIDVQSLQRPPPKFQQGGGAHPVGRRTTHVQPAQHQSSLLNLNIGHDLNPITVTLKHDNDDLA